MINEFGEKGDTPSCSVPNWVEYIVSVVKYGVHRIGNKLEKFNSFICVDEAKRLRKILYYKSRYRLSCIM